MYCYVDETGQDTAGRMFFVSIFITQPERDTLLKRLERIEERSGKQTAKWKKAHPRARRAYVQELAQLKDLEGSLFVADYRDSKDYVAHTADAIARALRHKRGDRAIVYVDALSEAEQPQLKRQLRPSVTIPTQVRGVRREENNAFIRLVDAICGLVRDADEGNDWAQKSVQKFKREGVLVAI